MLTVGLTGGIASGKSTVSNILIECGVPLIDADVVTRELSKKGEPIWQAIYNEFGKSFFTDDGEVDRRKLAELIFSDSAARLRLDRITHPLILNEINKWINDKNEEFKRNKQNPKVIVVDGATLIESGFYRELDEIWLVVVSEELQKKRLMERDNLSMREAEARIRSQMPLCEKIKYAHRVIDNSGSVENTKNQVLRLLSEI